MKVGPIQIEKEFDHQLWSVSLSIQSMSYYTRWYSSHLYTKQSAIRRFLKDTHISLMRPINGQEDLLEQAETALLFLEISEMR